MAITGITTSGEGRLDDGQIPVSGWQRIIYIVNYPILFLCGLTLIAIIEWILGTVSTLS